jgi:Metallo-peptidase family M12
VYAKARARGMSVAMFLISGAAWAVAPGFDSRELARVAAGTPIGGEVRLAGVRMTGAEEPAVFALERFQVFAEGAGITVHGDEGEEVLPAPANVYFRGTVAGETGSRVFLAVLEDGTAQGIVTREGEAFLIGGDGVAAAKALVGGPLEMRRVEPVDLEASRGTGFNCAGGDLAVPGQAWAAAGLDLAKVRGEAAPVTAADISYTARVAVETDHEFFALFNDTAAATSYVGNLIGFISSIYSNEVGTSLVVQSLSLWTSSNDPWSQGTPTCGLMEFGRYWNLHHGSDPRTIAHFLSGRALGGGVAWIGALCTASFSPRTNCPGLPADAPWGGGYGFTAGVTGAFDARNPRVMWDVVAVAHEIGHNFNSPHSHCYNGIGGNAQAIDSCSSNECRSRDTSGTCTSYCSTASAGLPGPAGSGSGTIMSYCHLVRSSFTDISLNFGTNHPYGTQPGREAEQMRSYVAAQAAENPGCLAYAAPAEVFSDSFETGKAGSWQ